MEKKHDTNFYRSGFVFTDPVGNFSLDSEDKISEVQNDMATTGSSRNGFGVLLDYGASSVHLGGLIHDQNTNANSWPDSSSGSNRRSDATGSSDRVDDEVKNASVELDNCSSGICHVGNWMADDSEEEIAPSARLSAPANQASFDAQSHVPVTCGKREVKTSNVNHLAEVNWAIENYTVDPIKNSKNMWRIRLRCRKTGCKHEDHLGLKTVSFMSDSAFQKVSRGSKKYADWKKQVKAENAGALRQGN